MKDTRFFLLQASIAMLMAVFVAACSDTPQAPEPADQAAPPSTVGQVAETVSSTVGQAEVPVEQAASEAAAEELPPLPNQPEIVESPEVTLVDEEGAGKLYKVGDLTVCAMEGTHAEMGYQHGRLLAKTIQRNMKEGFLFRSLIQKGYTREYINAQAARMAKHLPPEYIEEAEGVIKGLRAAGVEDITYEHILVGIAVAEIQHHPPDSPPACSNFAVFGRWTPDGRLLHGRNLDYKVNDGAQEAAVTFIWRPTGGIPFLMVGWAGSLGSVSGMNARGITIGEMTNTSPDETFDGIPLFIIMRMILERTDSLEEAVAIMKEGPRTLGWNFVICDGKAPDVRALEVDAVACEVYGPNDPAENEELGHKSLPDAVRRTNHPCCEPQMIKIARGYGERNGMDLSDWEKSKPAVMALLKGQNTWQRYDWLGKQIEARPGGIDVPQALQLLANGPVLNDATLHAFVFDPANQTAYISNAGIDPVVTATKMPFTKLSLKEWFQ